MNLRNKLASSLKNLPPAPAQSAAAGSIAAAPPKASAPPEPAPPKASATPKSKRPAILAGLEQAGAWLRKEANDILAAEVGERTQAQYERNGKRLHELRADGEAISLEKFEGSASTYYAYRASVRYHAATRGLEALKEYDDAKKIKDNAAAAEAWQRVIYAAADLKTYPKDSAPGLRNKKFVANGLVDGKPEGAPARAKREGRKNTAPRETSKLKAANAISKKYPDWRSLLWVQLVAVKSPWLDHTAIAALTGARPEELRKAEFQSVGGDLRIRIWGAKVSETKGQEWRIFTVKNDNSEEFAHLLKRATPEWQTVGMPSGVKDYPDAFSAALARAGEKALPKSARMTGYVYRHIFASDLKADGLPREQIAAALGHAVTKTQDTYGRASGGTAGKRSLSVECASAIKITHDTRYTNPAPQATPASMTFTTPNFGSFGL